MPCHLPPNCQSMEKTPETFTKHSSSVRHSINQAIIFALDFHYSEFIFVSCVGKQVLTVSFISFLCCLIHILFLKWVYFEEKCDLKKTHSYLLTPIAVFVVSFFFFPHQHSEGLETSVKPYSAPIVGKASVSSLSSAFSFSHRKGA